MKKLVKGLLTAASVMLGTLSAQALEIGQSVPLFSAESTQGTIHLGDLLGETPGIGFLLCRFHPGLNG